MGGRAVPVEREIGERVRRQFGQHVRVAGERDHRARAGGVRWQQLGEPVDGWEHTARRRRASTPRERMIDRVRHSVAQYVHVDVAAARIARCAGAIGAIVW